VSTASEKHRVITFDTGVSALHRHGPDTIEAMANDAVTFIRAFGFDQSTFSLLPGRHDRPGHRLQNRARPQVDKLAG